MTCEVLGLLFDYYREKPRKPCPIRLPRFSYKMAEICAISTKPLPCRAFRLDGLITLTLKVVRSSRIGRTNPVMVSMAGFFCVKTISSKIVQGRFPHKLPLLFITVWSFVFTEPRDRSQKGTPVFRGCFLNLCRRRHTAAFHFSLFNLHLPQTPHGPWPQTGLRRTPAGGFPLAAASL